jgi:hypothetical protein
MLQMASAESFELGGEENTRTQLFSNGVDRGTGRHKAVLLRVGRRQMDDFKNI